MRYQYWNDGSDSSDDELVLERRIDTGTTNCGDEIQIHHGTVYDSQRRTVSWAVQASMEGDARLNALVRSGPGHICIGAKPPPHPGFVPDAIWCGTPCMCCRALQSAARFNRLLTCETICDSSMWGEQVYELELQLCPKCQRCITELEWGGYSLRDCWVAGKGRRTGMSKERRWITIFQGKASIEDVVRLACAAAAVEELKFTAEAEVRAEFVHLWATICQCAVQTAVNANALTAANMVALIRQAKRLSTSANFAGIWRALCQAVRDSEELHMVAMKNL